MKKLYIYVLLLIALLFTIGCNSYKPPKQYNIEKTRVVNMPFDKAWTKIITIFATRNTHIYTIEKSSGFIAMKYKLSLLESMDAFDCGRLKNNEVNYNENFVGDMNLIVEQITSEQTKITINYFYTDKLFMGQSDSFTGNLSKIECVSTGMIENLFFELLTKE
jgi:hypothetical protein